MRNPKSRITTRKNAIIKETNDLLKRSEVRYSEKMYLIEGARLVEDAVRSKLSIYRLFCTDKALEKYYSYISNAINVSDEFYIIDEHITGLISDTKSTQGVFAVVRFSDNLNNTKLNGKILVLENIQDPSNMGNIIRTAEALGINNIMLCGECCDILSPKVLRGSMGGIFRLNFTSDKSTINCINTLKNNGYTVYGSVPDNKSKKITSCYFTDSTAIAIGNEGNGLTVEFKSFCDELVTIPMNGRAESLNASTAAAIIMWEMTK